MIDLESLLAFQAHLASYHFGITRFLTCKQETYSQKSKIKTDNLIIIFSKAIMILLQMSARNLPTLMPHKTTLILFQVQKIISTLLFWADTRWA